jgi:hypothetical protein
MAVVVVVVLMIVSRPAHFAMRPGLTASTYQAGRSRLVTLYGDSHCWSRCIGPWGSLPTSKRGGCRVMRASGRMRSPASPISPNPIWRHWCTIGDGANAKDKRTRGRDAPQRRADHSLPRRIRGTLRQAPPRLRGVVNARYEHGAIIMYGNDKEWSTVPGLGVLG